MLRGSIAWPGAPDLPPSNSRSGCGLCIYYNLNTFPMAAELK